MSERGSENLKEDTDGDLEKNEGGSLKESDGESTDDDRRLKENESLPKADEIADRKYEDGRTKERAKNGGKNCRRLPACVAALLLFLVLFAFFTRLLEPKYATELEEGSMISEYYAETTGHDVIILGDSEVYSNFSPLEMYREAGITAWVRGSPHQLIWQSYYILEETFTYETPQAVVLNVRAMIYPEPISEEYNRLTIDYMRWSPSKVGIILASMTSEESFLSYVFPLLRYHSRYSELTEEDIAYFFTDNSSTWNGYQMNKGVQAMETLPTERLLADYSFGDVCVEYLDKIRELCEEHGTELILVKAPGVYPYWYDGYEEQIVEYADTYGLSYYNFLAAAEEIGIDYSTDTWDAGLHMNLAGATKLSDYFARILAEEHGIPDRSGEEEIAGMYEAKLELYDRAAAEE
ncbi:MAG: SGNH/GDSL hydrolase family protein [Lachnospiraceae bacterium]|nr:SGNH/GDSL hydrolase family protein [Lachnospiraceae bacterium]